MNAPRYFPKGEKKSKIPQGARRDENRRTLNFPNLHRDFRKTLADCGDNVEFCPVLRKQNTPAPRKVSVRTEKFRWRSSSSSSSSSSSRKRLASNSNQGSPNTQTLPTLTLFLPLQVHGSWLVFFRALLGSRIVLGQCVEISGEDNCLISCWWK